MRRLTPQAASYVKTALVFLGLLALFNGAAQLERRYSGRMLDTPYTRAVTWSAGVLADWVLPFPVSRKQDLAIGASGSTVILKTGCNGLEALMILAAGVLAFPTTGRRRVEALLLYLPALFVLNLFRIVMLLFVSVRYPEYVDVAHLQVGQGILVLVIFAFWMHYVRWAGK